MKLTAGSRLGPYEIKSAIGAGGFGEVYKARDTRLDRAVAIKILPSPDPDLKARFEREAKAIASLQHPHICTLLDVGHHDGTDYLVMEYLEGETLEDRLRRKRLKVDEALKISAEIADALDKAHRVGIVHRDLKPANIMLTKEGVKLLDYGLAKLRPPQAGVLVGMTATLTQQTPLTGQGGIVGTLPYMAPEQVEGREVDHRADIWAFGCVVYEMTSGMKAFEGKSPASVIAAILEREPPPLAGLQPLAPAHLDHIVRRCLAKNRDERWQSSRDLLLELKSLAAISTSSSVESPVRAKRWTAPLSLTVVGILSGVLAGSVVTWMFGRSNLHTPARAARFVVTSVPPSMLLPPFPVIAVSPDGARVVYAMLRDRKVQLYVRPIEQVESTAILGTEGGNMPFFSPDGRWLAFFGQGKLKKVQLGGSAPTILCDAPDPRGGTWGADGTIVFAASAFTGLSRVSSDGGTPETLTTIDKNRSELSHRWPTFLPDASGVLFSIGYDGRTSFDQGDVGLYSLKTGTRRVVLEGASFPRALQAGYLLFTRGDLLIAAPFDLSRQTVTGRMVTVETGIATVTGWGSAQAAVSEEGTLVYVPAMLEANRDLVWVDRSGHEEPIPLQARVFSRPRISPDGQRILVIVRDGAPAIWLYDATRGVFSSFASVISTSSSGGRGALWTPSAVWSPDGRMIAYTTDAGSEWKLWRKPVNGSAPEEMLVARSLLFAPTSWSPDGATLALDELNLRTRIDVAVLTLNDGRTVRPLLHTEIAEENGRFSPDGRWLAYDTGLPTGQVYLRAFPGPGPTIQVSGGGGRVPIWARNGRELFYWTPAGIMVAHVSGTDTISLDVPRLLIPGNFLPEYDVSPDGRRFLVLKQHGEAPPIPLEVVTGWLDHVRRSVGAARTQ